MSQNAQLLARARRQTIKIFERPVHLENDNDVLKSQSNDCKVELLSFKKDTEELKQLERRVNQEKHDIEKRLKQSENELLMKEGEKNNELKLKQDLVFGLNKQILEKDEEIGKLMSKTVMLLDQMKHMEMKNSAGAGVIDKMVGIHVWNEKNWFWTLVLGYWF